MSFPADPNLPIDKMYVKDEQIEPQFVAVMEEDQRANEAVDLPVEVDGTLLLETLVAQFPGATGLRYKHEDRCRAVRVADGHLFPVDMSRGWGKQIYVVNYPKEQSKRKAENAIDEGHIQKKRVQEQYEHKDVVKQCRDLILLNLPFKVQEPEIREYFEKEVGEIATLHLKREKNGQSRGYGFLRFRSFEDQEKALSKRHFIEGRFCDVKIPQSQTQVTDTKNLFNRIFLGNIHADIANHRVIRDHFNQYGVVTDVFVPESKSCAFVTLETHEQANKLIGQQHEILGHSFTINSAVPKPADRQKAKDLETGTSPQNQLNPNWAQFINNQLINGPNANGSAPPPFEAQGNGGYPGNDYNSWNQSMSNQSWHGQGGGGWGGGWGNGGGNSWDGGNQWSNQGQQQQQQSRDGGGNSKRAQPITYGPSQPNRDQPQHGRDGGGGGGMAPHAHISPDVLAQALQTVIQQYPGWPPVQGGGDHGGKRPTSPGRGSTASYTSTAANAYGGAAYYGGAANTTGAASQSGYPAAAPQSVYPAATQSGYSTSAQGYATAASGQGYPPSTEAHPNSYGNPAAGGVPQSYSASIQTSYPPGPPSNW